jgi:cytochrome b561/polyisoprenoid-binding protein YceI
MPTSNTASLYGTVTKSFHWLTAILTIALIPMGVIANQLPYETSEQLAQKAQLFSLHKTLGVAVFVVALARILWAVRQIKPGHLHTDRKLETWAADVVHWLLYISLVIVPLSGWIEHAATSGFAPIWWPFGQSLPFVPKDEYFAHVFASLHWIFGKVMVLSILLHVAGSLKHHFVDRDNTLRRMWFGASDSPKVSAKAPSIAAPIGAIAALIAATAAGGAAGFFAPSETIEAASLEAVQSDWTVSEGQIGIAVQQFSSPLEGEFTDWTADISFDPTPADIMGNVTTTISIGSLTLGSVTDQAMGPDFFDQSQFATATFTADIMPDGETFSAQGTLTIKGTSVPVTLPFTLDLDGNTATMSGNLSLNRMDFGVGQSMNDETSLGFGVDVSINLTASKTP